MTAIEMDSSEKNFGLSLEERFRVINTSARYSWLYGVNSPFFFLRWMNGWKRRLSFSLR